MTRRASVFPRCGLPRFALLIAVCSLSFSLAPFSPGQTTIKTLPITITKPGVYELTKDLGYSGSSAAIDVETSGVVVDFQGYKIQGPSNTNGTGVLVGDSSTASNVIIQNGTIENFGAGVELYYNSNNPSSLGQVAGLLIVNTGSGITVDQPFSVIRNNVISQCTGPGINAPDAIAGILIAGNKLINCATGVDISGPCYLTGNVASGCTTGFDVESSTGTARFNTTTNCTTPFTGSGVLLNSQNY
jgi:hypothetical protein